MRAARRRPKLLFVAILTSFKVPGDPHAVLASASETVQRAFREVALENGNLAQVIVDEGDGLRFFHLWDSEDGMRRTAEHVRPAVEAAGLPAQQEWRQWDVVSQNVDGRAPI